MTVKDKADGWLDYNRHRSYPIDRDEWRRAVPNSSGLDCVVLDAMLFDQGASEIGHMTLESIDISQTKTVVSVGYSGSSFSIEIIPDVQGREFETVNMKILVGDRYVHASMSFSSHEYILKNVGVGHWDVGCRFLKSRSVSLTGGSGVSGISVNGSSGVPGHDCASVAKGDVVLEDGYRTSPVIWNGDVFVRVGTRYGMDPCKYDYGGAGSRDCKRPLFFFCGQNAINGGNIVIKGGNGISVSQGGNYMVRDQNSRLFGKNIPCVEIVAGQELHDICTVE